MADEEEEKVAAIAVVVTGKQRDCEKDLAKAEPALIAAQEALNTLNKVHTQTHKYTHSLIPYGFHFQYIRFEMELWYFPQNNVLKYSRLNVQRFLTI